MRRRNVWYARNRGSEVAAGQRDIYKIYNPKYLVAYSALCTQFLTMGGHVSEASLKSTSVAKLPSDTNTSFMLVFFSNDLSRPMKSLVVPVCQKETC